MHTVTKPDPHAKTQNANRAGASTLTIFNLTFQGVFVLQFEDNSIRALVPEVHHHVFSVGGKVAGKNTKSLLKGVVPNSTATPQDLGWDPSLLLKFPAFSSVVPFAQIELPYPQRIIPENTLEIELETPTGKDHRKATASCRFEYEIANLDDLQLDPAPQKAFQVIRGESHLLVRTELPEGMLDTDNHHAIDAFAATMKLFPGIHGFSLVNTTEDRTVSSVHGGGANCKAPIVVSGR